MGLLVKKAFAVKLGTFEALGDNPNLDPSTTPLLQLENIISAVIGVMTLCGGLYFVFQVITSAYHWMNSGGDKAKLSQAQQKLVDAVTGLVVVLSSYSLISLLSYVFGWDIFDLAGLAEKIWPST